MSETLAVTVLPVPAAAVSNDALSTWQPTTSPPTRSGSAATLQVPVASVVASYLDYVSPRNRISNTALNVLGTLDSTRAVAVAMQRVSYGILPSTRSTALGILGRYGKGRPEVTALCISLLQDKDKGFRSAAARSLDRLGDPAAIPALEAIAGDSANPASASAKAAVESLKKKQAGGH